MFILLFRSGHLNSKQVKVHFSDVSLIKDRKFYFCCGKYRGDLNTKLVWNSGDLNTDHLNTGSCWFFSFGFQMVLCSNGWFIRYILLLCTRPIFLHRTILMVPTLLLKKLMGMWIWNSPVFKWHFNTGPFGIQPLFDLSITTTSSVFKSPLFKVVPQAMSIGRNFVIRLNNFGART